MFVDFKNISELLTVDYFCEMQFWKLTCDTDMWLKFQGFFPETVEERKKASSQCFSTAVVKVVESFLFLHKIRGYKFEHFK